MYLEDVFIKKRIEFFLLYEQILKKEGRKEGRMASTASPTFVSNSTEWDVFIGVFSVILLILFSFYVASWFHRGKAHQHALEQYKQNLIKELKEVQSVEQAEKLLKKVQNYSSHHPHTISEALTELSDQNFVAPLSHHTGVQSIDYLTYHTTNGRIFVLFSSETLSRFAGILQVASGMVCSQWVSCNINLNCAADANSMYATVFSILVALTIISSLFISLVQQSFNSRMAETGLSATSTVPLTSDDVGGGGG
jgi:hypothetical protein